MRPDLPLLRIALCLIWAIVIASAGVQAWGLNTIAVAAPVTLHWRLLAQALLFLPVLWLIFRETHSSLFVKMVDFFLAGCAIAYAHFPSPFFDYIWDVFLIETTYAFLLSRIFLLRPEWQRWQVWPLRLLLFKLMFSMGVIKFWGGMPEWRDGTAQTFFWANQPMPAFLAWHAAQLPLALQKAMAFYVFLVEIPGPFLVFGGKKARLFYFWLNFFLQIGILVSGNYGIFNLLTIALGFSLWDFPRDGKAQPVLSAALPARLFRIWAVMAFAGWLICSIWYQYAVFSVSTRTLPETSWIFLQNEEQQNLFTPLKKLLQVYAAAKTANPYALFGHIAKYRMEIELWGSHDRISWRKYRFKVKPDELDRAPIWYAPHHWRLDHQLYYEASRIRAPEIASRYSFFLGTHWMKNFLRGIFANDVNVTGLLRENPFSDKAPRYLQLRYAYYSFTTEAERKSTGNYWKTDTPHPGQFFDEPFRIEELDRLP